MQTAATNANKQPRYQRSCSMQIDPSSAKPTNPRPDRSPLLPGTALRSTTTKPEQRATMSFLATNKPICPRRTVQRCNCNMHDWTLRQPLTKPNILFCTSKIIVARSICSKARHSGGPSTQQAQPEDVRPTSIVQGPLMPESPSMDAAWTSERRPAQATAPLTAGSASLACCLMGVAKQTVDVGHDVTTKSCQTTRQRANSLAVAGVRPARKQA